MFLLTGRVLLLILLSATVMHAQSYLPVAGKWSQTDSRDFIGIWKFDVRQALLDGTGKGTINNITARLGTVEGIPFTMDFTGDARDEFAIYYPGTGILEFYADIYTGVVTATTDTGITGAIPLAGQWGSSTPSKEGYALYQPLSPSSKIYFFQAYSSTSYFQERKLGNQNDIPIAGDWDGNGMDGIALFNTASQQINFYQAHNSKRPFKKVEPLKDAGIPLAGDWNGDGVDEFGLFQVGDNTGQFLQFASDTFQLTDSLQWTDQPLFDTTAGRQLIYTNAVPHTDIDGHKMLSYDPKKSFFPKGIDKVILDSLPQITAAGFNVAMLSALDYPIPASTIQTLDSYDNNFRMVLPFQELGGYPLVGKSQGTMDMLGIYDPDYAFVAVDTDGDRTLDYQRQFGVAVRQIVRGDWNGDGVDGYAIVQSNNQVRIGDTMEEAPGGAINIQFKGTLLAMDNDKDPDDEYAIFHDNLLTYYHSIYVTVGTTIAIPSKGDTPIIGDWNGDGKDGYALYNPATGVIRFYEEVDNTKPLQFKLVNTTTIINDGPTLIAGDWDGDGSDGIGFYHATATMNEHTFLMYNNLNDLVAEVDSASAPNPMLNLDLRKYTYAMYTYDEPSGPSADSTHAYLDELYKAYVKPHEDEISPLFYHTDTQIIPTGDKRKEFWDNMNQIGEVISHDDYPIGSTVHTIARIGETIGCSLDENRPNWFTLQTFASASNRLVTPTPHQVKAMVYTAIIHGATGFFAFMYDDPARFPEYSGLSPTSSPALWSAMTAINKELDQLAPFILTKSPKLVSSAPGEDNTDFRVYTRQASSKSIDYENVSDTPIRTLLKKNPATGEYLIMAVNVTDQPFDAIISLPNSVQPMDGRIVKRMYEEGDIMLSAGAINDTFGPFDVHLYQISSGDIAPMAAAERTSPTPTKIFSIRAKR